MNLYSLNSHNPEGCSFQVLFLWPDILPWGSLFETSLGKCWNLILSGYVMKGNLYLSSAVYQPECRHHKTELEGRVHSWANNVLIHQLQILGLSRLVQEHSWGHLCKGWTIISFDIFLGLCQKALPMNSGLYLRKCIADVLKIVLKSLWHSQIREKNTNPQELGRRKHKYTITSRMCFCPNYIRKKKRITCLVIVLKSWGKEQKPCMHVPAPTVYLISSLLEFRKICQYSKYKTHRNAVDKY